MACGIELLSNVDRLAVVAVDDDDNDDDDFTSVLSLVPY